MKSKIGQLDQLCERLGFNHFPRAIGNPRQHFVYASESVWQNFSKWSGSSSCFISTAGYDRLIYDMGKQIPTKIVHEITFFDFDHETKAENAFADAQRLSQFLREMDIAHWVQYSGSKGYHLFIIHAPTRFKFDHKDGSAEALKQILHQTQDYLKRTLGLNTLDEQTMGDPKRLCRFPFTLHADRHGKVSGRYAMPIEISDLDHLDHDEIVQMSYSCEYFVPEISGRKVSIRDFIEEIGVKLQAPETMIRPIVAQEVNFGDDDLATKRYIAALDLRCMGVVNELKRRNPPHKARVYSALFAKTLGISQQGFERIWMNMGNNIGYVDLHNHEYREYQMQTLFGDPAYHTFPNCTTLKANGCCVGEICPRFKDLNHNTEEPRMKIRNWVKTGDTDQD